MQQDAGKWYAECRLNAFTNGSTWIGVCRDVPKLLRRFVCFCHRSNGYAYKTTGNKTTTENDGSSYGNSYTTGDIIGIALDLDNNQIFFYKNGTIQNSGTTTTSITALNQGQQIHHNILFLVQIPSGSIILLLTLVKTVHFMDTKPLVEILMQMV